MGRYRCGLRCRASKSRNARASYCNVLLVLSLAEVLIQLSYNCLLLNVRFYISTGAGPPPPDPFFTVSLFQNTAWVVVNSLYRCAIYPFSNSQRKRMPPVHAAGSGRLVYCGLGRIHCKILYFYLQTLQICPNDAPRNYQQSVLNV